jgi:uncharacterized protein
MMIRLEAIDEGVVISVRAQPGSRKNAIVGRHDGALKIAVTAAPDKGKANVAIAGILADAFGISKSAVQLVSGHTARCKKYLLRGISEGKAREILARLLSF